MSRTARIAAALALAGCVACSSGGDAPVNTLNWQAASEEGIFGYLIYRSENREGPFRRINDAIVRVPVDTQERHAYTWVDENVTSGTTYYYYLDVVQVTGIKQRFSGIIDKTTP